MSLRLEHDAPDARQKRLPTPFLSRFFPEWRELTCDEVSRLRKAAGAPPVKKA